MLATRLPELRHLDVYMERAVEIVPSRPVTDREIRALERRYDVLLFERFADGTLLVTPPAGWKSSAKNMELSGQIWRWVREGDRGLAMDCSGGVKLPDGSLFAPDTTFVSRDRWSRADHRRTFAEVVPDAAFELLSSSDTVASTLRKIAAYVRNGVRLVVLIDPYRRHVYVAREGDAEARDLGDVDRVDCSPVMPGFVLDVAAFHEVR